MSQSSDDLVDYDDEFGIFEESFGVDDSPFLNLKLEEFYHKLHVRPFYYFF